MPDSIAYPDAEDLAKVGSYPTTAGAGGGFVWDEVLEYRVWCHPERGAPDEDNGNDYYYSFVSYAEALECSQSITGAEEPMVLILQREHINEPEPGQYVHVTVERTCEWPPEFLSRPRRTAFTIPDFFGSRCPSKQARHSSRTGT